MMSGTNPLFLTLEFVRAVQGGDPYAFRMTRQEYLLRSAGGGFESVELGWDEALLADLNAIRRPLPDPLVIQQLGEKLRQFLQPAGWSEHETEILAAVKAKRSVILTLRSAAAELYALPWELVTIKSTGQHLAELPGVLLRYEWPETTTMPATPLPGRRGRILVGWSAAGGAVPAADHLAAIERACRASGHSFSAERDVIANLSVVRLAEALDAAQNSDEPVAVLHLLCHGGAIGKNFGLLLDGDDVMPHMVDAAHLRRIIAPHVGMVRLVVLAACNSANSGDAGNQLGSVAQGLHRAGIAQVVASRYPLSVVGSIQLVEELYQTVVSSAGSLEAALLRARDKLARLDTHIDWVSVQLFARASDGSFQPPLFGPAPSPPPAAAKPASPAAARRQPYLTGTDVRVFGLLILLAVLGALLRRPRGPHPAPPPSSLAVSRLPDGGNLAPPTSPALPGKEPAPVPGESKKAAPKARERGNVTIAGGVVSDRRLLSVPTDGTIADLYYADDGSGHQRWHLVPQEDGTVHILVGGGVADGRKYLSGSPQGTGVSLAPRDDGSGRQRWRIVEVAERTFHIMVRGGVEGNFIYLSVRDDGSLVDLFDHDDGSGRQRWRIPAAMLSGIAIHRAGTESSR